MYVYKAHTLLACAVCPSPYSSASRRCSTEETVREPSFQKMGNATIFGNWTHVLTLLRVRAQTIPKCKKHPSSRVRVHANSTYSPRTGSTSPTRWAARSLPTYRCARPPPALPVLARLTPLTPPQKISLVCGENCLLESTPLAPSPQSWRPWPHRVSSSPSLCAWLLFCQDSPIGAAFPLARVPATN